MNEERNSDNHSLPQRVLHKVVHIVHHEVITIPITFAASLYVFYEAISNALSGKPIPQPIPAFRALPFAGFSVLVALCSFFLLQGALAFTLTTLQTYVVERSSKMPFIFSIVSALIYGWLSGFVSLALIVNVASDVSWAAVGLFAAFFLSLVVLIYYIDDDQEYSVIMLLLYIATLAVFYLVLGSQIDSSFFTAGK